MLAKPLSVPHAAQFILHFKHHFQIAKEPKVGLLALNQPLQLLYFNRQYSIVLALCMCCHYLLAGLFQYSSYRYVENIDMAWQIELFSSYSEVNTRGITKYQVNCIVPNPGTVESIKPNAREFSLTAIVMSSIVCLFIN